MKLTKRTDFVLRTLIYLAHQDTGKRTSIQEIAKSYHIPANHLTKIVHQLGQLGYVNTYQGRGGGIELAKPTQAISLKQVILAFEPDTELLDCSQCALRNQSCKLEKHLYLAQQAFFAQLQHLTLADIL